MLSKVNVTPSKPPSPSLVGGVASNSGTSSPVNAPSSMPPSPPLMVGVASNLGTSSPVMGVPPSNAMLTLNSYVSPPPPPLLIPLSSAEALQQFKVRARNYLNNDLPAINTALEALVVATPFSRARLRAPEADENGMTPLLQSLYEIQKNWHMYKRYMHDFEEGLFTTLNPALTFFANRVAELRIAELQPKLAGIEITKEMKVSGALWPEDVQYLQATYFELKRLQLPKQENSWLDALKTYFNTINVPSTQQNPTIKPSLRIKAVVELLDAYDKWAKK